MKLKEMHILPKADLELFSRMANNYQSDKEKWFFENIKELEQWDCSIAHDIILSQADNVDNIFLIRINCNEYMYGCDDLKEKRIYHHVMTLSDALNDNLKQLGVLPVDITLFEWLRARNYEGVSFERNLDYE